MLTNSYVSVVKQVSCIAILSFLYQILLMYCRHDVESTEKGRAFLHSFSTFVHSVLISSMILCVDFMLCDFSVHVKFFTVLYVLKFCYFVHVIW